MNTLTIDQNIYNGALEYAKLHNVSLQSMVEEMLKSIISTKPHKDAYALPSKWEKLCGILNGVTDDNDERFNYIINK